MAFTVGQGSRRHSVLGRRNGAAGRAVRRDSGGLADSDEFRTLIIPGDATSVAELSTEELRTMINNLYQNMFGRDGDSGGLDYWTDQLETGARSLVDISTAIADGAPPPVRTAVF